MEEKPFAWTCELNKRLLQVRHENEWLFKKKKQPWREFHQILLENGFPKTMTVKHVRKKWAYMYDTYKIAKKSRRKDWKYYKMFGKIFGSRKVLDKYDSWTDEWRLKLITCISETQSTKVDLMNLWRTVEKAMRSQNLPLDCCVQDMKGLWRHIKMTFQRKYRMATKKAHEVSDWALYDTMLEYYRTHEPSHLEKLETYVDYPSRQRKASNNYRNKNKDNEDEIEEDFQWSKDITETFIQIRLQHDWLFRERKWAWNDLLAIMIDEYEFPKTLSGREICRKWASTYSEYQKAKATNNKAWIYFTLFELYLGEGSLSLNPLVGWHENWISIFISTRTYLEQSFKYTCKDQSEAWREVEKKLRSIEIPMDHSLLDLPEIWTHLQKTYKWKRKFADKGILTEQWPYYEAMARYEEVKDEVPVKINKDDDYEPANDDDYEDDMKLCDLKQNMGTQDKMKIEIEIEEPQKCRSCSIEQGCINIFDQRDEGGYNLAYKLNIIGGVEVEANDNLPPRICLTCLNELENAYKFRRRCQMVDQDYRNSAICNIKVKRETLETNDQEHFANEDVRDDSDETDIDVHRRNNNTDNLKQKYPDKIKRTCLVRKLAPKRRKKKKLRKMKYEYWKVCEICGKNTKNLKSHLDMHSTGKFYSCDVCDKKFKFKSGLVIHKAIHDPTPRKTCEICGKTFHVLAQYRRHFVYHANERKYECQTCGKRFNTLDILRVHIRIHTDERPFPCPICRKTFRTAGCVSRHKKVVHKTYKKE